MELQILVEERVHLLRRFTPNGGSNAARQRQDRLRAQGDAAIITLLARAAWINEGCTPGRETGCVAEVTTQFHATRHLLQWDGTDGLIAARRRS